jgi:hypothetical protein
VSFFTGENREPEHSRERIRLCRILFKLTQSVSSEFESLPSGHYRVSFFTGRNGEPERSRERIRLCRILFELALVRGWSSNLSFSTVCRPTPRVTLIVRYRSRIL